MEKLSWPRKAAFFFMLVVASMACGKWALAETTLRCDGYAVPADIVAEPFPNCEADGGTIAVSEVDALVGGDIILFCVGGAAEGVCSAAGGSVEWHDFSDVTGETLVYVGDGGAGSYLYASGVPGWPGGVPPDDPPAEGCEPFTVSCVDTVLSTQAFSSGFILVALFWALGKGIELVLGVIKRF